MKESKQADPLYTLGLILGCVGALFSLIFFAWPLLGPIIMACVFAAFGGSELNASISSAFNSVVESTDKLKRERPSSIPTQFGTSTESASSPIVTYPGSRLVSQTNDGDAKVLKFQTPTPENMVRDFLRNDLQDKGFSLQESYNPNVINGTRTNATLTVTINSPFAGTTEYELRSIVKP